MHVSNLKDNDSTLVKNLASQITKTFFARRSGLGAIKLTFDLDLTFQLYFPFSKVRLKSKVSSSKFFGPGAWTRTSEKNIRDTRNHVVIINFNVIVPCIGRWVLLRKDRSLLGILFVQYV